MKQAEKVSARQAGTRDGKRWLGAAMTERVGFSTGKLEPAGDGSGTGIRGVNAEADAGRLA